jgi:hypothetical protein
LRKLPDGTSAQVTVLYLGPGQAYYCNPSGGVAGIGRPAEKGWEWEPRNDLAPTIADLIAVYHNEKPAVYVPVPAKVD